MQELMRFIEPRRAEIAARTRALAAASESWSPIVRQLSADEATRSEELSHALQFDAVFHGRWEPYLDSLRRQGEHYARAGVSFSAWFELLRGYREVVSERVVGILAEDPQQNLSRVLTLSRGLNALIHLAIEQIGEGYLDAKQQELARSHELHRAMFDKSPLPMWTFDRTTLRFLTVNEAAVRHYGYSREEFATMTLADIRPDEDIAAMHADVANAQGFSERTTWRHRKKDGTLINVDVRANDFELHGTNVRLVLIIDVTERLRIEDALRKTETQLRHAQKMEAIGRLAGGVAHDFNNVLTVIKSFAYLLEESLPVGDAALQDAGEIRRAAERASVITRQLLTLSRHSIAAPQALDLQALIKDFMPMLRRLVGETISINVRCDGVPKVIADPGQIEQVLMNLAVNARDAMADGGRLSIECHFTEVDEETARLHGLEPGPFVELAVTDTGTGMDAETQMRIFEPFFTTKDATKGTGLGLSIVHGIVSQAGGRIAVYSEVGHGTTFRVQLPVATGEETPHDADQVDAPRTLPPLRVLVVDDQPDVRAVAARILRDAGCSVIVASTAAEARKICVSDEEPIDVVLLDVVMSDARGDVLVHELRELRPSMAFVLMSGYTAGALRSPVGMTSNLVAKPFSPAQLRAAIARACKSTPESSGEAQSAGPHHRALVADDDDALRKTVVRVLRKAGFDVVDVDSGYKAIQRLEAEPFDVVITDVQMPDGGGLDLLRAARRVDLDVPVILMTGQPSIDAAAEAVEYGAFRYLTKPVETAAFVSCAKHAARAYALARIRREALTVTGAHAGVTDRAGLEVRFDRALEGLWMAFQPIVHASSGVLFGVEALMRSDEPSLPHPGAVLDAATQLNRLTQVGRKVRLLSSAALGRAPEHAALFVNLHPDDLFDVDLIDEKSPMSRIASRVILEVTERASLDASPALGDRVAKLRKLGYRIAVDDIGAGYSGLTSFTELKPEIVKIDMSLVRDVHKSALKQRTIAALCQLCHEIDTLVVGEGVETLEERDALVSLGCDLLQGYLIGRPQREIP